MAISRLEQEEFEAAGFQKRLERRRRGDHKPKPIKSRKITSATPKRFLVIGDSHAHPEVTNERYTWLGNAIASLGPDVVVDIGDSADMPSLMHWDKARPTAVFEGFTALHRDLEAYFDAQDRLMEALAKSKFQPKLLKTQGNHEYRLTKVVNNEPRLRGLIGEHCLRESEYGWRVTPFGRILIESKVGFCHHLAGGSSKTGPRGVVTANPGTSGVYVYGHTHRRGVYHYSGLKPCKGTIINAGCYFDVRSSSHRWAGDDVLKWHSGLQLFTVDKQGHLLDEEWFSYETVQRNWG